MAVCVNCKKKLGYINTTDPLWSEAKERLCNKCRVEISGLIQNPDIESIKMLKLKGWTEEGQKYLYNYYEYWQRTKGSKLKAIEEEAQKYNDYLLTTGYDFVGYKIKKYIKVISGETVLGTGFLSELSASFSDFFGTASETFAIKLESAKDAATKKLIDKSIILGGNAVIGVDFDYITFGNNMIGVIANGTSVIVETVED